MPWQLFLPQLVPRFGDKEVVFGDVEITIKQLLEYILRTCKDYHAAFEAVSCSLQCFKEYVVKHVAWSPPLVGWLKVNIDGSVTSSLPLAACGGILGDSNGNFVTIF